LAGLRQAQGCFSSATNAGLCGRATDALQSRVLRGEAQDAGQSPATHRKHFRPQLIGPGGTPAWSNRYGLGSPLAPTVFGPPACGFLVCGQSAEPRRGQSRRMTGQFWTVGGLSALFAICPLGDLRLLCWHSKPAIGQHWMASVKASICPNRPEAPRRDLMRFLGSDTSE
jgi:hypothetical protein